MKPGLGYLGRLLFIVNGWWLVLAAVARLAIQITHDQPLDALPFISAALGATALTVVFTDRKPKEPTE